MAHQRLYTYNGKQLPEDAFQSSEPQTYLSLTSWRMVQGQPRSGRHRHHEPQINVYLYGTDEEILAFQTENHLQPLPQPLQPLPQPLQPLPAPKKSFATSIQETFSELWEGFLSILPKKKKAPPPEEKKEALPLEEKKEEPFGMYIPDKTLIDVADVPQAVYEKMSRFTLIGLEGKAKVINIHDGDTMDILVFISIPDLCRGYDKNVGRGRNAHQVRQYPAISAIQDGGFFAIFDIRLEGIDAAESDTAEGQVATKLTDEAYQRLNYIVYFTFNKFDKYGRLLATLYDSEQAMKNKASEAKDGNLNKLLLNRTFEVNGVMKVIAEAYDGGTKSEYMKNLPRIRKL